MIEDDQAVHIRKYALPLVVAVTGHRDLAAIWLPPSEMESLV
jgi:hypothetical protein